MYRCKLLKLKLTNTEKIVRLICNVYKEPWVQLLIPVSDIAARNCLGCIVKQPNSPWQCNDLANDARLTFHIDFIFSAHHRKQAEVLLVESENTFLWHKISEKQTRGCSHILRLLFIFLSFFSSGTKSTLLSPLHEHIPASVFPDRWASGVCHIKTPRPKPTADEAHMFLQWKDITDFTLTCLCLLNPLAWYLIFGAILGHSLGFAAKGLYCKLWSHHSSVPHSRTLDYVNLCK